MNSHQPISRIAIIGAGPVGIAFAKFLVAEKAFDKIDIFEQRDRVGGIWNLSEPTKSKRIPIPQVNPRYGHKDTMRTGDAQPREDSLEFETPLYDYLETNIPKEMMAFSDKPFPDHSPLYPSHQEVLKYLVEYAEDVKHLIRFSHKVRDVNVDPHSKSGYDIWRIQTEDLKTGSVSTDCYDAVVVTNGHYTVPSLPEIEGLEKWNRAYPNSIIHSKAYRRPEDYTGQKVLVIGNSASGLDIAFQVIQKSKKPVLMSSRSISAYGSMPRSSWRKEVREVVEFLPASEYTRAVKFRDGSIETDIDSVVFATGYFYSYPFLSSLKPPVVTDGLKTQDVYQHLFNIEHPTLVFPVINLKVVPFPLAELQAAVVARVWSGRLSLPSKEDMRNWEAETIRHKGDGKYFHLKKYPEDAAQINHLYKWAESASKTPGLENGGMGKLGAQWNERQVWMRARFADVKAAYSARGKDRTGVKSIEELGFDFDEWRPTASPEDLKVFRTGGVVEQGVQSVTRSQISGPEILAGRL